MKIQVLAQNNVITAHMEGELDHHSSRLVRELLDDAIDRNPGADVVMDMRHVSFMDSSGIGMMMGRYRRLQRHGGRLRVQAPSQRVDRILSMSGLYSIVQK